MTRTDPLDTPEAREWARRVLDELVPMIDGSAASVSLVPKGETDVKFAVELGLSIMLDKPIILAIAPGQKVPEHLARVADEIVEIGLDALGTSRVMDAVRRVLDEQGERDQS